MDVMQRNRSFGWWSLLCWLSLGMLLEAMHGFKVGWYLDVVNDARRLQLTLAHSHGTLLALINLAFVATVRVPDAAPNGLARAGACLRWAGLLMPLGFLFGGVFAMGPDPSFAIVLVPIGGLLLFAGVLLTVRSLVAPAAPGAGSAPAGKPPPKGR
ncbi:MAG TPA: hypothetical protein VFZ65_17625 [Planctomycetota bacterium]|nr:hypothetical protein [Planctomycetota bacterium]